MTPPYVAAIAPAGLAPAEIHALHAAAFDRAGPAERRFLAVVPDATRKLPVAQIFDSLWTVLGGRAERLDALVAQGTHPAIPPAAKRAWVFGQARYPRSDIFDHPWDRVDELVDIGAIPLAEQLERFGEHAPHAALLGFDHDLSIRVNRRLLAYDRVILVTRVQPHEVAGYAGGAKQIFPGVSGPEMINLLHAIGSLRTNRGIHGVMPNPVRDLIDDMARHVPAPLTTICLVIDDGDGSIRGAYVETDGWREGLHAAARQSAELNVRYVPRRVRRLVAALPRRADGTWVYPELWTGAKGILKTEDAVADGGELVLWAPNIHVISEAHGELMQRIGFHSYAYLLDHPESWKGATPLALNGSALVKGEGRMVNGVEVPRIDVRLATAFTPEECRAFNLGYEDPRVIATEIESTPPNAIVDGRMVVRDAGAVLWRFRPHI